MRSASDWVANFLHGRGNDHVAFIPESDSVNLTRSCVHACSGINTWLGRSRQLEVNRVQIWNADFIRLTHNLVVGDLNDGVVGKEVVRNNLLPVESSLQIRDVLCCHCNSGRVHGDSA